MSDQAFVNLVEIMGGDLAVVNGARVSYGKSSVEMTDRDERLLNRLLRDKHGTPFEQAVMTWYVRCPIFVAREWFRHRIGCLAGDTPISLVSPSGAVYKRTIEQIYFGRHGVPVEEGVMIKNGMQTRDGATQAYTSVRRVQKPGFRMMPNMQERTMRVLNENTNLYTTGKMKEVWEAGVKSVYLIKTEDGREVRASAEHPFLTDSGWVRVADLIGDECVAGSKLVPARERPIPPRLRQGIGLWATAQRELINPFGAFCYRCGGFFSKDELDLDHVVPVSKNLKLALDEDNLKPCCKNCHREKISLEQPLRVGQTVLGVKWIPLAGKPELVGEEMTYDIEMEGPNHNYVASGLVVHNSFNEISGRYKKLQTEYYIPKKFRQPNPDDSTSMNYKYIDAPDDINEQARALVDDFYKSATALYNFLGNPVDGVEPGLGIANEHARIILPVGIFTEFRWTVNARALMNFLALRNHPAAMGEIRAYAKVIEHLWSLQMPVTAAAFVENGRVAP